MLIHYIPHRIITITMHLLENKERKKNREKKSQNKSNQYTVADHYYTHRLFQNFSSSCPLGSSFQRWPEPISCLHLTPQPRLSQQLTKLVSVPLACLSFHSRWHSFITPVTSSPLVPSCSHTLLQLHTVGLDCWHQLNEICHLIDRSLLPPSGAVLHLENGTLRYQYTFTGCWCTIMCMQTLRTGRFWT